MTKAKFEEITAHFNKEQARWEKLKVGQFVYEEHGNGWDFDYFKIEITAIDIDNREITGLDHSQNKKVVTLSGGFRTHSEWKEAGVNLVEE